MDSALVRDVEGESRGAEYEIVSLLNFARPPPCQPKLTVPAPLAITPAHPRAAHPGLRSTSTSHRRSPFSQRPRKRNATAMSTR